MEKFTASEVRYALHETTCPVSAKLVEIIYAYADRLEADEKAVPVATVEDQFGFPIMEWIGDAGDKCPVGTKLYTHSDPSDAKRLAEALVRISLTERNRSTSDTNRIDAVGRIAREAHSAQAQPQAASVPDGLVDALRHQRQIDEDGAEVGVSRQAVDEAANILAMLAAQENPNG